MKALPLLFLLCCACLSRADRSVSDKKLALQVSKASGAVSDDRLVLEIKTLEAILEDLEYIEQEEEKNNIAPGNLLF